MKSLIKKKEKPLLKNKRFLTIVRYIEEKVGTYNAGTLIAVIADSLDNLTTGVDEREVRTVEVIYNNFYSTKYDFAKQDYVE